MKTTFYLLETEGELPYKKRNLIKKKAAKGLATILSFRSLRSFTFLLFLSIDFLLLLVFYFGVFIHIVLVCQPLHSHHNISALPRAVKLSLFNQILFIRKFVFIVIWLFPYSPLLLESLSKFLGRRRWVGGGRKLVKDLKSSRQLKHWKC